MKRIQVTIKQLPGANPKYPLHEYLFDAAEGWEFSPAESTDSDDTHVLVFYGQFEHGIVAMLRDTPRPDETYEIAVTEISDAEYQEIKTAMDEFEDDAEFFARMKAKYH
ncbi:MAG: hypothetical protein WCT04_11915 [Planctomycetota bacterium]